jgi:hypothetical protein
MQKYFPPEFKKKQFHCIHCAVFAAQHWHNLYFKTNTGSMNAEPNLIFCVCSHCDGWSYWFDKKMIVPSDAPVEPPHPDMPQECVSEYLEARSIVSVSPRAASALLRLAVQQLMPLLGESGKNINNDIASLVNKGLPVQVQQALDFCRVVGNNAVHPGEIDLKDTPEIAHHIFAMINFIIEDRISRPKHIESLYMQLPEAARNSITDRDENKT